MCKNISKLWINLYKNLFNNCRIFISKLWIKNNSFLFGEKNTVFPITLHKDFQWVFWDNQQRLVCNNSTFSTGLITTIIFNKKKEKI